MSKKRQSILAGVEGGNGLLAEHFGAYLTKTGAKKYLHDGPVLRVSYLETIYQKITENYEGGADSCSLENWRFKPVPKIKPSNKSAEKILEKTIIKWPLGMGNEDWANQVPVASGLVCPSRDKKRNIDLIHKLGVGIYEFIELKIRSNNPLSAAIEILVYGLLYIFYREQIPERNREANSAAELLRASKIYLKVAAPDLYYKKYDLKQIKSFEKKCSQAIQRFASSKIKNLELSFGFESFIYDKEIARQFSKHRKALSH